GDAGSDRQVRHERRAVAARALGDAAHQAPAARRGSRGENGRQDGLPTGLLHLSGNLGRDHRPRRDQVREGALPTGTTAMSTSVAITIAPFPAPSTLEQTGLGLDQIEMLMVKMLYGG